MNHPKEKIHPHTNRLINEKSPYLLQHAHNPVDWYPWGAEAFEKARRENKPVLLSIGYSTCHWCHVMEQESFEDNDIARLMNETLVAIKVDREERPEIDHIYMTAVTAMIGQGGWPLNVFLTPDKKPFYGGTYFPPEPRYGSPGFKDVLASIAQAWRERKEDILQSSQSLTERLATQNRRENTSPLDESVLQKGYQQFAQFFDAQYGGFGEQPKFPSSHNLSFLLRYWRRTKDEAALLIVEKTLTEMYRGGMYDHLGGGFHRYSTDRRWQVPHFEKMLYDQAILARTYLEAYQATHKPLYAQVAREIFEYVLKDLRHPDGGFYSAEDADSYDPQEFLSVAEKEKIKKREGAFYIFRQEEIVRILGESDGTIFNSTFGVEPTGNAEFDPHGEFIGKNILFLAATTDDTAGRLNRPVVDIEKSIALSKEKLLQERSKRPRPYCDDKILVDWNGLLLSALAFGGRVLNEPRYTQAATQAAAFILKNQKDKEGRLLHRFRDGESAIAATLSDYAFFIAGLLDCYEATFTASYLEEAISLARRMVELFWDEPAGGFFTTAADHEELLFRPKELYDGAIPSGNSIAALDLLRLGELTFDQNWNARAERLLQSFSGEIASHPSAYAQMLIALDFSIGPRYAITIVGNQQSDLTRAMISRIYDRFLPNLVVLFRPLDDQSDKIFLLNPFLSKQIPASGQTTAYLCRQYVCQPPVVSLTELEQLLDQP